MAGFDSSARSHLRLRQRLYESEDRRFDRRHGIDTEGIVEPTALTVAEGDPSTGFTYVATPVRVARWWLRALPGNPSESTFVDMGSGKGRVLALAAVHGFRRVIGVEFATELHEAALANARAAAERGVVFEPRLGDAATFQFPEGPIVVHFNNPFAESVMERVITNIARAYERGHPPLVVVYQQRTVEDELHDTANLDLLSALPFLRTRSLEPTGRLERWLLSGFTVRIFESPEAR